jgi:hypothetical protein
MNEYREGLKAEINLWREMITESELSLQSIEYRRMEIALQLAEVKLRDYEYQMMSYVSSSIEH